MNISTRLKEAMVETAYSFEARFLSRIFPEVKQIRYIKDKQYVWVYLYKHIDMKLYSSTHTQTYTITDSQGHIRVFR